MNEKMKQLLETVSGDAEFTEKLKNAPDAAAIIALAKEKGFDLTEEDLKPADGIQEISDDEIESVAGGKKCYCFTGGGGEETKENEGICACVLIGMGGAGTDGNWITARCECFYSGFGHEGTD